MQNSEQSEDKMKSFVKNTLPLIYLVVGLFALRWTLVEPYVVPTASMEPTLKIGDRLYALKCAYDIRFPFTNWIVMRTGKVKRGDVVLFVPPMRPDTFVKRAVAIPGDKVKVVDGQVFVNGEEVPKTLFPDTKIMYDIDHAAHKKLYNETLNGVKHYMIMDDLHPNLREQNEVTVPEGKFFAMGDNRDNSSDSRQWGFASMENLKGKGMFIWFSAPVDSPEERPLVLELLKSGVAILKFWDWNIRFERIGTLIQ